ncbi:palmitoyltransferase ZDHHC22-like isoform X2 [Symsagittifera roscoffensis]|uniref:palmitoyltransferase ZDHHC22-like isoform X2 n=1 Tax=Symsagittifera roscoffensis TaxID=84072 RepID=UPI00307C9542
MVSCEECEEFLDKHVDVNKFSAMILIYSLLLPFVYFPTIFPNLNSGYIILHILVFSYLWVCLVYNYFQMVFSRRDFYRPVTVDPSRTARMHYCKVCRATVLKRDHHCYFYGVCVGYYNLKHFMFVPYWGAVCCAYSLFVFSIYYPIAYNFNPDTVYKFVNHVMGNILMAGLRRKSLYLVVNITLAILATLNTILLPLITLMFLYLTAVNQTTHEYSKGIRKYSRSLHQNLTEALGPKYWLLLFSPWTFQQTDYFAIPTHHVD